MIQISIDLMNNEYSVFNKTMIQYAINEYNLINDWFSIFDDLISINQWLKFQYAFIKSIKIKTLNIKHKI